MKKISVVIVLFLLATAAGFAQAEQVSYDGINYLIVATPRDLVDAYEKNVSAALKFKINDYQKVVYGVRDECDKRKIDLTRVFMPTAVISAATKKSYSARIVFSLMEGGATTPNEDVYIFNSVKPKVEASGDQAAHLRKYFRHIADLWWPRQNKTGVFSPELKPGSRICDSCNAEVKYNDGYCYGYETEGWVKVYRLWCNDCLDKKIIAFSGGEKVFDDNDLRRANEYARRGGETKVYQAEGIRLPYDSLYFDVGKSTGVSYLFVTSDPQSYLIMLSVKNDLYMNRSTAGVAPYAVIKSPDKHPAIGPVKGTSYKDATRILEKVSKDKTKETWMIKGVKFYYILVFEYNNTLATAVLDSIHKSMSGISVPGDTIGK